MEKSISTTEWLMALLNTGKGADTHFHLVSDCSRLGSICKLIYFQLAFIFNFRGLFPVWEEGIFTYYTAWNHLSSIPVALELSHLPDLCSSIPSPHLQSPHSAQHKLSLLEEFISHYNLVFVTLPIHSVNLYSNSDPVLSTVLGTVDTAMKKKQKPCLHGASFLVENNSQVPDAAAQQQQGKGSRMWRTGCRLYVRKGFESADLTLTLHHSNCQCRETASTKGKDCWPCAACSVDSFCSQPL